MKKFLTKPIVIILLLLMILVGLGLTRSNPLYSERLVFFQLGDYEYAVPQNYFGNVPNQQCRRISSLMKVILPEFIGRNEENAALFREVGKQRVTATVTPLDYAPDKSDNIMVIFKTAMEVIHSDEALVYNNKPANFGLKELTYSEKRKFHKKTMYSSDT